MVKHKKVSNITKRNWLVDITLMLCFIIATLSGIYFLFFARGGYQGGRNPFYDVHLLFTRKQWEDIHLWGGVFFIAAAFLHIPYHWNWIITSSKRMFYIILRRCECYHKYGFINYMVDFIVAISFLITVFTSLYFLFGDIAYPNLRQSVRPTFLFTRTTWDTLHTWAGVVFISAAVAHLIIHWKWITKVSKLLFLQAKPTEVNQSLALNPTTKTIS